MKDSAKTTLERNGFPRPARVHRAFVIEALRGLAALSVVMLHTLAALAVLKHEDIRVALPLEGGVDVFFVISGFVMVYSTWDQFQTRGATRRFVARRAAKILPLYWCVTTVFVLSNLVLPTMFTDALGGWPNLVGSYLMIPWPRPDGSMLPVFRLGWTLDYEVMFYVIFSVSLFLSRKRGLLLVITTLVGLVVLGAVWSNIPPTLAFWTNSIIAEFVLGMFIGIAYSSGIILLPDFMGPIFIVTGISFFGINTHLDLPRTVIFGMPASLLVLSVLSPSSIFRSEYFSKIALWLGGISYSLYLTHLFVVRALRELFVHFGFMPGLFVVANIFASLAPATVIHRVEKPVVLVVRRWISGCRASPPLVIGHLEESDVPRARRFIYAKLRTTGT